MAGAALLGAAVTADWLRDTWHSLPDPAQLPALARHAPSQILARDGQVLQVLTPVRRQDVPLERVSPAVIDALLATEDRRFHTHAGVDAKRVLGAAWATLSGRREGGSTLTQQLVRNVYAQEIGRAPTLERKLREAMMALRIERRWSKPQILAAYLNNAPFGHPIVGIEMAAQAYFSRSASQLDAAQAATLVAMLKGNTSYHPIGQPERALARRNLVLALMARDGRLPAAELASWQSRALALQPDRPDERMGPARHFVERVRRQAEQWASQSGLDLQREDLRIHTTLDPMLQAWAEEAMRTQLAPLQEGAGREWSGARRGREARPFDEWWATHPQVEAALMQRSALWEAALRHAKGNEMAARTALRRDPRWLDSEDRALYTRLSAGFLALDPADGGVRAWVGSPDFRDEPLDHVADTRRQPGSAFKPFVYGAAIAQGIDPMQVFADVPVQWPQSGGRTWQPRDGAHSGQWMPMADALALSRNGITAQVMDVVGPHGVIAFARAAGIRQAALTPVPALALGASEVSLLELTQGYATIASGGVRREPMLIARIEDAEGRTLYTAPGTTERTLPEPIGGWLLDMLRGPVDRGTARALRTQWGLRGDLAGKTGTSQRHADGWFVALRPDLVVGAWVGFNDARLHFRSRALGLAAHNALPMVARFLRSAQAAGRADPRLAFDGPRLPTRPATLPDGPYDPRLPGIDPLDDEAPPSAPDSDADRDFDLWVARHASPAPQPARMLRTADAGHPDLTVSAPSTLDPRASTISTRVIRTDRAVVHSSGTPSDTNETPSEGKIAGRAVEAAMMSAPVHRSSVHSDPLDEALEARFNADRIVRSGVRPAM